MKTPFETQDRLEKFVEEKLLKALACPEKEFFLQKTDLGIHNHVFFLDIPKRPPLVLKGIAKRQRFAELISCSNHLAERGINVPKILYAEAAGKFFKRFGMNIICEERIMGDTLQGGGYSEEVIARVAKFFSHMHGIKRRSWGKIDTGKKAGLYLYLLDKVKDKIKKWKGADPLFLKEFQKDIFDWIQPWKKNIENIQTFSLSHCDPNPGNIILSNTEKMYLLDTGHIGYLPRAIDFYSLQVQLCEDDEGKISVFEDACFAEMDLKELTEFKATRQFFKAYVLTGFGSMLSQRLVHSMPGDPYHEKLPLYLQKVKKMLSEILYKNS